MTTESDVTTDSGETAAIQFERANRAYAARAYAEAKTLYERLIEAGHYVGWANFSVGRILRDLDDLDGALASFEAAILQDSGHFWAHFERVDALVRLRAPAEVIGQALLALAEAKAPALKPPHVDRIESASMTVWDAKLFAEAVAPLESIADDPALSELALVRIVERSQRMDLRAKSAGRLMALPPTRDFTFRVLGNYYHETGNAVLEKRCLEQLAAIAPNDFQAYFTLARATARNGDKAALATLRADESRFSLRQRMFVELVVRIEEEDAPAALTAFRTLARLHDDAPLFPGIRLCYLFAQAQRGDTRDEVLAILRAFHPASPDVALVDMNACIERQDFAAARDVFDTRLAQITPRPMNIRLAELDLLAHAQALDQATAIADALVAEGSLSQQAFRMIARVYSEVGRHADVVALAAAHLATETVPEILSMLVRSARKAGALRPLFDALPPDEAGRNRAQQLTYEALVEDLAAAGDAAVIATLDQLGMPEDRLLRIASKLGRPNLGRVGAAENCVFLCADADYLVPALISIASAGLSNMDLVRRTPFALLVEAGETLDRARAAARALSRRVGMSIEVFDAADVVTSSDTLNARYGFFTGGQSLSLAAYYRIFLAEYLSREGRFAQALYIDSDTAVRGGLGDVFALPSQKPLMARPEVDRVEVRNAVKALNLQGTYFNSGVLRFDYRHADIAACLAGAIRCATDPNAVRLFQDQCALNVGFQMAHDPLPEAFNYFHAPRLSGGERDDRREAVIVHYIDRPKPWDSLYRRDAKEWFGWYDLVQSIISTTE